MTSLLPISVTIISRNEALRIEDAIRSVKSFASEVIVVDSESTDDTVARAKAAGATVWTKPFSGFGQQKNFAHEKANQDWVLNIDADERVSPELERELRLLFSMEPASLVGTSGFFLPRKTWYLNRWVMHSGWYPNYLLRLARKKDSKWSEPNLHEALQVKGVTKYLKNPLEHFSFPDQKSHILKNVFYADQAARDCLSKKSIKPGMLHFIVKPIWKFFDMYFFKRGFLDGRAGFFIAVHSSYALFLRYTYVYEQSLENSDH